METDSVKEEDSNTAVASVTAGETPAASASESSSEDEGVGGESLESDGSSPDSSEHPNDEENDWSEDSEPSLASASSETKSTAEVTFPAVLPATSVRLMAQAVGCDISHHAAAALGHLAMNKLRRVVMMANQLRKHDQSQGLSVDHFCVAEKLAGSQSFGHKATSSLPDFRHAGKGISVMENSTRIDLLATVQYARDNPKPLRKMSSLSLSHHQLPTAAHALSAFPDMAEGTVELSNSTNNVDNIQDFPQIQIPDPDDETSYCSGSSSVDSFYYASDEDTNKSSLGPSFKSRKEVITHGQVKSSLTSTSPSLYVNAQVKVTSKLEKVMEKVLILNEELMESEDTPEKSENIEIHPGVVVGIEWIDYMKVFVAAFFQSGETDAVTNRNSDVQVIKTGNGQKASNMDSSSLLSGQLREDASKPPISGQSQGKIRKSHMDKIFGDFNLLLEDVRSNGTFPVLAIILNFFNDYIHRKFGECDNEGLRRILAFMQATLQCSAQIDSVYLNKMWATLVKLVCFPPLCDLHQKIVQVLILLIQKGKKEFSVGLTVWTSEYITTVLNSVLTTCLHMLSLNVVLLNLSLSLVIALERAGIHLILDLDWHSQVLEFLQAVTHLKSQQNQVKTASRIASEEPMETDQSLSSAGAGNEEQTIPLKATSRQIDAESIPTQFEMVPELEQNLLVFFRLLMSNYSEAIPREEAKQIHDVIFETFGEKIVPYITTTFLDSDFQTSTGKRIPLKRKSTTGVIQRRNWKSKNIIVGKIRGQYTSRS